MIMMMRMMRMMRQRDAKFTTSSVSIHKRVMRTVMMRMQTAMTESIKISCMFRKRGRKGYPEKRARRPNRMLIPAMTMRTQTEMTMKMQTVMVKSIKVSKNYSEKRSTRRPSLMLKPVMKMRMQTRTVMTIMMVTKMQTVMIVSKLSIKASSMVLTRRRKRYSERKSPSLPRHADADDSTSDQKDDSDADDKDT